jgi:hypothetical protein
MLLMVYGQGHQWDAATFDICSIFEKAQWHFLFLLSNFCTPIHRAINTKQEHPFLEPTQN